MTGRDLEYEKEREVAFNNFNTDMERLSKAGFEDFKTGVIKHLRATHGTIVTLAESDMEQKLELIERIRILETFLLTLALVSLRRIRGQELSHEMKKTLASLLSIDPDKNEITEEELMKYAAKMGDKTKAKLARVLILANNTDTTIEEALNKTGFFEPWSSEGPQIDL